MPIERLENLIGDTPLMRLRCLGKEDAGVHVYGKLECFNPAGSVKDRSAYQLLLQARLDHNMEPGWTIVESSSGNMGHALAMLCAAYKLHFICVLDSKTPKSNIAVIRAYGGQIELVETPDETGNFQRTRIAVARRLARELPRCVNLDQYNNPAAIAAHFKTTGPEIYSELGGDVDVLIGCASTGSHLSGTAKYMKSRKPGVHVIGVEPEGSVVFGGTYKPFLQNGTGLSFRPGNLLESYIDEIIKVSDHDAFATCRRLARTEGLLLGGSSGSVLHVAALIAHRMRRPCNIAVILPDNGMKYLDTIYDDQWLRKHGLHGAIAGEDAVMTGDRPATRRVPLAEVELPVGELQ